MFEILLVLVGLLIGGVTGVLYARWLNTEDTHYWIEEGKKIERAHQENLRERGGHI